MSHGRSRACGAGDLKACLRDAAGTTPAEDQTPATAARGGRKLAAPVVEQVCGLTRGDHACDHDRLDDSSSCGRARTWSGVDRSRERGGLGPASSQSACNIGRARTCRWW